MRCVEGEDKKLITDTRCQGKMIRKGVCMVHEIGKINFAAPQGRAGYP